MHGDDLSTGCPPPAGPAPLLSRAELPLTAGIKYSRDVAWRGVARVNSRGVVLRELTAALTTIRSLTSLNVAETETLLLFHCDTNVLCHSIP